MLKRCSTRLLGLCLLLHFSTQAQYSDSTVHYTGYTSTGTFNQTNESSSYLFNHVLKYGIRKKDVRLNFNNSWLYGKLDEKLTNNDFSSTFDVDLYKHSPHFYYWVLANFNTSYSLRINKQLLAGVGGAYNVIDRKHLIVNLSDGILYDYSDINPSDSTREIYGTPRNSLRLRIKWSVRERLVFSGTAFIQNSLQDLPDYIFKSDVSLSVKIKKWLSFTSSYTFNRMTRTKTENAFLTYGITLETYF